MPTRSIDTSLSAEHPYATAHAYQPRNFSLSSGESTSASDDRATFNLLDGEFDRPTAGSSNHHSASSSRSSVPPSAHTYTLRTTGDVPLMAVNLHSWAASTADDPTYAEGQFISGSVDLNLRTPDKIKAVILSVRPSFQPRFSMRIIG